jgi:hypothetical protein
MRHINEVIAEKARSDGNYAVAYAILKLVEEQSAIATHIKYLGTGNAATTMGALECVALQLGAIAEALGGQRDEGD